MLYGNMSLSWIFNRKLRKKILNEFLNFQKLSLIWINNGKYFIFHNIGIWFYSVMLAYHVWLRALWINDKLIMLYIVFWSAHTSLLNTYIRLCYDNFTFFYEKCHEIFSIRIPLFQILSTKNAKANHWIFFAVNQLIFRSFVYK